LSAVLQDRRLPTALEERPQTSGRFKLVVKLETWRVFAAMGIDNRGSAAVGRAQGYVAPAINSLAIAGDSLDLAISSVPYQPSELRYGRLSYGVPIGSSGARISANLTYSEVWPGDERRYFNDYTQTTRFEPINLVTACIDQRVNLKIGVLLIGGHARIAHHHLSRAFPLNFHRAGTES